jgi:hypothetical protein
MGACTGLGLEQLLFSTAGTWHDACQNEEWLFLLLKAGTLVAGCR